MSERSAWVDYAKGFGILLVVYAHLLSSAYHAGIATPQTFFEISDSVVYSFHMPFFFFLSGLFVESSLKKRGVKAYLTDKLSRILYPYFIWSFIQVGAEVVFSSQTQMGATVSDLLAVIYKPWGQFWFLYALLWMHAACAACSYLGKFAAPALLALGALLFFFPISGYFALGGFSGHLLFFAAGVALKEWAQKMNQAGVPGWFVLLALAVFFGAAYYAFARLIPPMRLFGSPYKLAYLLFSALGSFAFTALSQFLARRRWLPALGALGRYSLEIYLVHMLAGVGARMVLLSVFGATNWLAHIIIGTSAALVVPIFMRLLSERMNFPYLFELKLKN